MMRNHLGFFSCIPSWLIRFFTINNIMVFKFNIIQFFYYYYYYYFGSGVNTMNTAMSKQLWYLHC